MQSGSLNAASLPPGTQVGPWRIVDLRGRGAHGTVYLAQGVEPGATGEVALKLALAPRDDRFPREVGLLSRVSHPCIPRLIDQGQWLSPFGLPHPFVVMEWVEGIPLYVWARDLNPSSRKVLGLLAGLARALDAVHSVGGVHRDVKGDNVLVRLKDGRGFLMDFGSSHHQGADTLTWQVFPPGTPAYRSPEAYHFALNIRTSPVKVYAPGPGDDLFALGITAYRLVTGQYPPMRADPQDAQSHVWDPDGSGPRPARELNPGCCPELSAIISWMLSIRPEARGSARELAEALEQAAKEAGPEADAPLFRRKASQSEEAEFSLQRLLQEAPWHEEAQAHSHRALRSALPPLNAEATPLRIHPPQPLRSQPENVEATPLRIAPGPRGSQPVEAEATPLRVHPPEPRGSQQPWLTASLAGAVVLGAVWAMCTTSVQEEATPVPTAEQKDARDAGTSAVGDSVLTTPVASTHAPSSGPPVAADMPPKPLPGQLRPDARGRCPSRKMVTINGGCWVKTDEDSKDCNASEYDYVYKGACYMPAYQGPRPPTSGPTESHDGGQP